MFAAELVAIEEEQANGDHHHKELEYVVGNVGAIDRARQRDLDSPR